MDELLSVFELHDLLYQDQRMLRLIELENKLSSDEEVLKLARIKDEKMENYNSSLVNSGFDSDSTKLARKEFIAAKEDLMNNPKVIEYMQAYVVIRDLYNEINSIILKGFNIDLCPKVTR